MVSGATCFKIGTVLHTSCPQECLESGFCSSCFVWPSLGNAVHDALSTNRHRPTVTRRNSILLAHSPKVANDGAVPLGPQTRFGSGAFQRHSRPRRALACKAAHKTCQNGAGYDPNTLSMELPIWGNIGRGDVVMRALRHPVWPSGGCTNRVTVGW
jgi:hypothetical protein